MDNPDSHASYLGVAAAPQPSRGYLNFRYPDSAPSSAGDVTVDPLDELLEKFTINAVPREAKFKFRKSISEQMIIGVTCSVPVQLSRMPFRRPTPSIMVKPVDRSKWYNKCWSKLEVSPRSVNFRSQKFTIFKYFRLQLELGYGHGIRSPLRWRFDTIWNTQRKLLQKHSMGLYRGVSTSLECRPHLNVDLALPQAEGGQGFSDEDSSAGLDLGHCHVGMPLVEFVYKF
mmetsp:Transcript_8491/g.24344  ORF Transcript_8491/g.24344 Transcript_8491/m.24344 type:complete len:229 (-) Transcript_8491:108-794(-)